MRNKVVFNIINIYCLINCANAQYDPQVYGGIQHEYRYPYQNVPYQRYSNQRPYQNCDHKKWMQENYEDYNDYVDDICACDKCDETITKPACRNICPNCFTTPPPVLAPSYVFVPFPYPYPVAPNKTLAPETPTLDTITASSVVSPSATKTTEVSTTETKTGETAKALISEVATLSNALLEDNNNDVLRDKSPVRDKGTQYSLTVLRRTKPNWLPKYGIVPISDRFAEKLMLQHRSMKVLHSQKDNNLRKMDEITPAY